MPGCGRVRKESESERQIRKPQIDNATSAPPKAKVIHGTAEAMTSVKLMNRGVMRFGSI